MLDFYESAISLNISSNNDIGTRGWQACARTLKKVFDNIDIKQNCNYSYNYFLVKMFRRIRSKKHNSQRIKYDFTGSLFKIWFTTMCFKTRKL